MGFGSPIYMYNRPPIVASSGGGGGFDPSSFNLTLWERASYSGAPWSGTASAGNSGSHSLVTSGLGDLTVGPSVNGFTCADTGAGDKTLQTSVTTANLWTNGSSALMMWFLFKPISGSPGSILRDSVSGNTSMTWASTPSVTLNLAFSPAGSLSLTVSTASFQLDAWNLL